MLEKELPALNSRSEILFLYDVTDANPNGDPDENKPRIDSTTGKNFVTDVRLKRTIREYWKNFKGKRIFIDLEESINQDGTVQTAEKRFDSFKETSTLLKECIDVRAFGALIPIKKKSIKFVGPVQFRIGHSLNKVNVVRIRQSAAFASGPGKHQRSFGERYVASYSLVNFYGVINENNAKLTGFSEDDALELFEGLWNGTKNLTTSSKFGHMPRLLLRVEYNEPNFFIGELDSYPKIVIDEGKEEMQVRSTKDYRLDMSALMSKLKESKEKIGRVQVMWDRKLNLSHGIGDGLREEGIKVDSFGFAT